MLQQNLDEAEQIFIADVKTEEKLRIAEEHAAESRKAIKERAVERAIREESSSLIKQKLREEITNYEPIQNGYRLPTYFSLL